MYHVSNLTSIHHQTCSLLKMRCVLILNRINCFTYGIRFKSDAVRVRFAPSPTGYLHLGGLRTALYNFLFAKKNNGKFILRIEDTDQTRLITGAAEQLKNDLLWAGIEIDEGPGIGGSYGPYIQSERLECYQKQVEKLLENGAAYQCFCTERRLDLLRREAIRNREVPKYDNKCRSLTKEQIAVKLHKGEVPCIRFKLSSEITTFEDLIYGPITCDISQQEGDPVIIKSDGYPTYHFANVVDDHFMKISHVLRGVEWQISTTKHLLLYRAFGWSPPQFGHLPLLLNSDGSKFSKRQGDIKISHYRNDGIFPLSLINFIVDVGGGFQKDLQQNMKPELYDIDELARQFDLQKLKTHSGKLMPEKLLDFNRLEIKRRLSIPSEEKKLVEKLKIILKEHFKECSSDASLQIDDDHVYSVLNWSVDRIDKLSDLLKDDLIFIWNTPKNLKLEKEQLIYLNELVLELEGRSEFSKDILGTFLRLFAEQHHIKVNVFMKTLRSILSGLKQGPSVAEMMEILGKDETLRRVKVCLNDTFK